MFEIDEEDDYYDYLAESDCYDCFMREDFDEFKESCPASGIDETKYEALKAQLTEEGLDWEDFSETFEGGSTEVYDYDPVNQKYLDAVKNDPLFQSGVHTISAEELGVSEEEYGKMSMEDVYAAIGKRVCTYLLNWR